MRLYHASPVPGITVLEPRVSNHGRPLLYFSEKRENVLVYLSNAIEKYCRTAGFSHDGPWQKWGPYGFTKDGRMALQEYYPNALAETYAGAAGYIYTVEHIEPCDFPLCIPFAVVTARPAAVVGCEYVPDALEAILSAARQGRLVIERYEENRERFDRFNRRTIPVEYENAADHPEYRFFLRAKFPQYTEDLPDV